MNTQPGKARGALLHVISFVSGGLVAAFALHPTSSSSAPASASASSPLCLPSSSPFSSSLSATTHMSTSAQPHGAGEEAGAAAPVLGSKHSVSTPHFVLLGQLPLFAKVQRRRLDEGFDGRQRSSLALQLRRSPKTIEQIEEEYYWQEGEEEEEEEEDDQDERE